MIVRLMGEGQYFVEDTWLARLNEHDEHATEALDTNDAAALERYLGEIWELVRQQGTGLGDEDLSPSDCIVPPLDLSLEEARELMGNDGFIPDLPVSQ